MKIEKTKFAKICNLESYKSRILKMVGNVDIWYSYGIPLNKRFARIQILHVSNALSLKTDGIVLSFFDRVRFFILGFFFKRSVKFVDLWSCESKFTMSLITKLDVSSDIIHISKNGLENEKPNIIAPSNDSNRYFVAIGTYSYKRLDLLISWFLDNSNLYKDLKLKIIGEVPELAALKHKSLEWMGVLPHTEVLGVLKNSFAYISFSEIENSSNALAEAAQFNKKLVVSDIASHREFLDLNCIKYSTKDGILETIDSYKFDQFKFGWQIVNAELLDRIRAI
ncbi:MAG: hypothetical protein WCI18_01360 [Pseudomonadota bacterium]